MLNWFYYDKTKKIVTNEILEDFVNVGTTYNGFELIDLRLDDSWENPFNLEKSVTKIQRCFRDFQEHKQTLLLQKKQQLNLNFQKFKELHKSKKFIYYLSTNVYYN